MVTLKCCTMESTTSLERPQSRHWTSTFHSVSSDVKKKSAEESVAVSSVPVDPSGTFIRLDVHLVQVDVDFGDFHLEAVGQKLDRLSNGAIAGSLWQRKQGWGFNGSYRSTRAAKNDNKNV